MDTRSERKINFQLPLLSIKRHTILEESSSMGASVAASRIPFCWEDAPGVPKDLYLQKGDQPEDETPRLKLPPGRLSVPHPRLDVGEYDHTNDGDDKSYRIYHHSDALSRRSDSFTDVLSLTEAIDIAQKTQESSSSEPNHCDSNGYLTLESAEQCSVLSPSYIIERFLPDAAAIAASSALAMSMKLNKNTAPYRCHQADSPHLPGGVRGSYGSSKGCGLHMLLPWRAKQRICGVKSSVSDGFQITARPKSNGRGRKVWRCKE